MKVQVKKAFELSQDGQALNVQPTPGTSMDYAVDGLQVAIFFPQLDNAGVLRLTKSEFDSYCRSGNLELVRG